jgi:pimeloyl-ACP methyl ester carboxylesterase
VVSGTTTTVTDERVEVARGVRLHVRRWRAGTAPARSFLLVHGLASNARTWDAVAARLAADGHPTVAVDLRGHGESDQPPDGYDTQTAARDLAALCKRLGLVKPVLAGQSWGGNVVLELAVRQPGRAHALALLDGGWLHLADAFPDWAACWRALAPPKLPATPVQAVRERLRAAHPDWPDSGIEGTLGNFAVRPDGTVRPRLHREQHQAILYSLWVHRPRVIYPRVDVPVLLLPAGSPAAATRTPGLVREAAAVLPHAEVRWYEGADHDLHAQHPARVAADLETLA